MLQRVGLASPLIHRRVWWLSHLLSVAMLLALVLLPSRVAHAETPVSGPVVVRPGGAQLYRAPDGEALTTLATGTIFTAQGRTADDQWLVGETWVGDADEDGVADGPGQKGWLPVARVIIVGMEYLPIVDTSGVATNEGTSVAAGAAVTTTLPATNPVTTSVTTTVTSGMPATDATNSSPVGNSDITSNSEVMGTVASGDDRLNVRSGPGTAYAIVAKATTGDTFPVMARNADGTWLQIDRGDGTTGWVSASFLTLRGDPTTLPVGTAASPPPITTTNSTNQTAAPTSAAVPALSPSDNRTGSSGLSGMMVIESSPGGMLYAYSLDSGATWPLTNGFDPAISPDGTTVTFVRDGGENGIYLIDMDGSNERLIWSGRTRLSSPKWSPDGQWILFTRSDGEYHCLDTPGSCISPNGGGGGRPGFPGGDGAGLDTVTRYWYNLARIDRDGNNYRDIASLTSARAADWNEAGIVYQSNAGLQITADVPDAENKLVIFDYLKPFYDDPDWQPNGGRIVYMGKEASHWELFAVNPDGSGKTSLTRPATTVVDVIPSNVAPAWSPDGQHIAFLSNREENGEAGTWRVWVMDADGSNQRALPVEIDINYTFGGEQSISWIQ